MKKSVYILIVIAIFNLCNCQNPSVEGCYLLIDPSKGIILSLNFVDDHTVIIMQNFVQIQTNNEYKLHGDEIYIVDGYFLSMTFKLDANTVKYNWGDKKCVFKKVTLKEHRDVINKHEQESRDEIKELTGE